MLTGVDNLPHRARRSDRGQLRGRGPAARGRDPNARDGGVRLPDRRLPAGARGDRGLPCRSTGGKRACSDKVVYNPFYVSTHTAPGTRQIAAVTFSMNDPQVGSRTWSRASTRRTTHISVYSRGDRANQIGREQILDANRRFLARISDQDPTAPASMCDDWGLLPARQDRGLRRRFWPELEAMLGPSAHLSHRRPARVRAGRDDRRVFARTREQALRRQGDRMSRKDTQPASRSSAPARRAQRRLVPEAQRLPEGTRVREGRPRRRRLTSSTGGH